MTPEEYEAKLMGAIRNKYAPMSHDSRAGRTPETADSIKALHPLEASYPGLTRMTELASAPARGLLEQPVIAGKAINEAINDPSIANMTNAGVQAGLSFPVAKGIKAAVGAAGAGLTAAGIKQSGLSLFDSAQAADPLDASSRARLNALQKKSSLSKAEREEQNTYLETLKEAAKADAKSRADADLAKANAETAGQAAKDADKRKEDSAAVARSNDAFNSINAKRSPNFNETPVGEVYNKMGGYAPFAGAALLGGIGRLGHGPGTTALTKYGLPAAEGFVGALGTLNAPLLHNGYATDLLNPEKAAYAARARELPEGHPDKKKWEDYARPLPELNQVGVEARKELTSEEGIKKRLFGAMLEGPASGLTGSALVSAASRTPGVLASLPNRMRQGAAEAANKIPARIAPAELAPPAPLQASPASQLPPPVPTGNPLLPPPTPPQAQVAPPPQAGQGGLLSPPPPVSSPYPPSVNDYLASTKGADWAKNASGPARAGLLDMIGNGRNIGESATRNSLPSVIRAKELATEATARGGMNAKGGAVAESTMKRQLDMLRDVLSHRGIDIAKLTPAQLQEQLKTIDPRVFMVPAAAGIGAGGLLDQPQGQ